MLQVRFWDGQLPGELSPLPPPAPPPPQLVTLDDSNDDCIIEPSQPASKRAKFSPPKRKEDGGSTQPSLISVHEIASGSFTLHALSTAASDRHDSRSARTPPTLVKSPSLIGVDDDSDSDKENSASAMRVCTIGDDPMASVRLSPLASMSFAAHARICTPTRQATVSPTAERHTEEASTGVPRPVDVDRITRISNSQEQGCSISALIASTTQASNSVNQPSSSGSPKHMQPRTAYDRVDITLASNASTTASGAHDCPVVYLLSSWCAFRNRNTTLALQVIASVCVGGGCFGAASYSLRTRTISLVNDLPERPNDLRLVRSCTLA